MDFTEILKSQAELQEKYKNIWQKIEPKTGRDKLLWMMIEAGEAADIIKKKGDEPIVSDPEVRRAFIEELCDTLMYFGDVMLCYGITEEELEKVHRAKHERNMKRW